MVVLEASVENGSDYYRAKPSVRSYSILKKSSLENLSCIEELGYQNIILYQT